MAQTDNTRAMEILRVAAFIIPATIALILLVVGGLNIDRPWGVALLLMGFFGLFAVGVGKWQESSALSSYSFFFIMSLGVIWVGFVIGETPWRFICITGGISGMLISGIGATISVQLNRLLGDEGGMVDAQVIQLKRIQELLERMHENIQITDNARRVLHRDTELKLLRRRVDDVLGRGDYDAALDLCDEIEKAFGPGDEADAFRHRVLRSRQEHHEAEIHGAMEHFDRLLRARDWAHAHQEAARIRRLFPDSDRLSELDRRIHAAREHHKQELLDRFNDAVGRDDVETAMSMLKELDRYLTREEAAQLTEQASSIVERHRDNLSTRFKMAVNDRRWQEAIQIGDLIRNEFPNSKMAEEVNSMIDVLRTRVSEASSGAGASATGASGAAGAPTTQASD